MNVGSLFSGIGGFDLACEQAGMRIAWQVEIDRFCNRALERRWPNIPRVADVRTAFTTPMPRLESDDGRGRVDCLVGGFPCQDLSVAGKRAGLAGERSGLFWEIVRIAKAIRPTWGLFENVPGLLSSHGGRDFALVVNGLRQCWPCVGWRVLDSRYFGVAQRRRRVFFVCGSSEASVRAVLFEPESRSGDSPASGEAGADVAYALAAGTGGSKFGSGRDGQDTFVVSTLKSSNGPHGHSFKGDGDEANLVVATLNSGGNNGGFRTEPGEHLIVEGDSAASTPSLPRLRAGCGRAGETVIAAPLTASYGKQLDNSDRNGGPPNLVYQSKASASQTMNPRNDIAPTLNGTQAMAVGIRRLTPLECERLQAFPDGWTCLCQPLEAYADDPDEAAMHCICPDSPRYRALGNAVTVSVVQWLVQRIFQVYRGGELCRANIT